MGLVVLTASSTQNLVALATVRTRLLAGDTGQDALLSLLIAEASAAMASYLWPLGRQRYQWTTGGSGRVDLVLPRWPIDRDSVAVTDEGTAVTTFTIRDAAAGILRLETGWPQRSVGFLQQPEQDLVVTFTGGYVLPDQIATWAGAAEKAEGVWVRPSSPALSPLLFEATTAGTTHASVEPTWPTTGGETVTDGTVVWTARDAVELPAHLSGLCYTEVYQRFSNRLPGLAGMSSGGYSETYFERQVEGDLSPITRAGLDRLAAGAFA